MADPQDRKPTSPGKKRPETSIVPSEPRQRHLIQETPLEVAGQAASKIAGRHIFQRYLKGKSANTIKRHARDLELFAEYLLDVGISPEHGADFQNDPRCWYGVTWGIVEGFLQWQLSEGYAVSTVNARLSTVRTYAQMAVKAGVIDRQEGMLIQSVKGFSRQAALNVDQQRPRTRIDEVTYDYKREGRRRSVVVTRRSTKKAKPTAISDREAVQLKRLRNQSPQAHRDALLMCLLLDHGLRASEAAIVRVSDIDLTAGQIHFFRPKVKGTDHEWTRHKLTSDTARVARPYIEGLYPPPLFPDGSLILATTRLLKNGEGGLLLGDPMSRIRISERVAWLGKQLGIGRLSAHDCRHYAATRMARLGYGVDELMAWFGWTNAQTAMRYVASAEVRERDRG